MKRVFEGRLFYHFDWPLFFCIGAILLIGLANLFSATFNLPIDRYFWSQMKWVVIGFVGMFLLTLFDYRILERFAYVVYALVVISLAVVMFSGRSALGAQRWLQLGPLSIQPSELAKLGIAFCLAKYFHSRRSGDTLGFLDLIVPAVLTMIPFVLILKQPDLGTALIVACVAGTMTFFAGLQKKLIVFLLIVCVVTPPLAWEFVLRPYQKDRVHAFLNPEAHALSKGYQVIQSKIAIGSGQLSGKGYLKGTQSKLQFLPKQHTDFVFSTFAEEFGFLGSVLLVALYASVGLLGLNVAFTAKDKFGMMLAFGLTMVVTSQAAINIAMETGALPVVGVPLPLFSYGGTSMITTLVAVGLLLNISMRRFVF